MCAVDCSVGRRGCSGGQVVVSGLSQLLKFNPRKSKTIDFKKRSTKNGSFTWAE